MSKNRNIVIPSGQQLTYTDEYHVITLAMSSHLPTLCEKITFNGILLCFESEVI